MKISTPDTRKQTKAIFNSHYSVNNKVGETIETKLKMSEIQRDMIELYYDSMDDTAKKRAGSTLARLNRVIAKEKRKIELYKSY
ncbi:MAG: hypothetical protein ACNYZG_09230 [Gammaproteobacteria bacterium]